MVAAEIRKTARESLSGKWGKAALMTLVFFLIEFGISFVLGLFQDIPVLSIIASIVNVAITTPLSFGLLVSFIKLKRDEDVTYTSFFNDAFSSFGRVWGVVGNIILKLLPLIILLIVFIVMAVIGMGGALSSSILSTSSQTSSFSALGIIGFIGYIICIIALIPKSYLYSLSFYILHDNPQMSTRDIVEKSETLMRGNRWNFFWLSLTFIGWAILSVFTLYIGLLWLYPYIMISAVVFYESRIADTDNNKEEIKENNDNNPIQE
jgi:uncharacterized membrane protein